MGAAVGEPTLAITLQIQMQLLLQGPIRGPASLKAHVYGQAGEGSKEAVEVRPESSERDRARRGDCLPGLDQHRIPSTYIGGSGLQGGVPLLKSPLIPGPLRTETWFHVE